MKQRIYYGCDIEAKDNAVMFATITGQMSDGTYVYTECDGKGNLINLDKQYTRHTKYGMQVFVRI